MPDWTEARVFGSQNEDLLIEGLNYGRHYHPSDIQAAAALAYPMKTPTIERDLNAPNMLDMLQRRHRDVGSAEPSSVPIPPADATKWEDVKPIYDEFFDDYVDPLRAAEGSPAFQREAHPTLDPGKVYSRETTAIVYPGAISETRRYPSARFPTDIRIALEMWQSATKAHTLRTISKAVTYRERHDWLKSPPGEEGCYGAPAWTIDTMFATIETSWETEIRRMLEEEDQSYTDTETYDDGSGYTWAKYRNVYGGYPITGPGDVGMSSFYIFDCDGGHGYQWFIQASLTRAFFSFGFEDPAADWPTINNAIRLIVGGLDPGCEGFVDGWERDWTIELWLVDPSLLIATATNAELWNSWRGGTIIGTIDRAEAQDNWTTGEEFRFDISDYLYDNVHHRQNVLMKISYDGVSYDGSGPSILGRGFDYFDLRNIGWTQLGCSQGGPGSLLTCLWRGTPLEWDCCVDPTCPAKAPYEGCAGGTCGWAATGGDTHPVTGCFTQYGEGIGFAGTASSSRIQVTVDRWRKELVGLDFEP